MTQRLNLRPITYPRFVRIKLLFQKFSFLYQPVFLPQSEQRIWTWEWEPFNRSEEVSDLNGTDAGFFVTSLPPLSKIREDGDKSYPLKSNTAEASDINSNCNSFTRSSPELSRRCNSPEDGFRCSSLRNYKKKVASISPYKFESCDSDRVDVSSCNSRLSWCSEELSLTGGGGLCPPINGEPSTASNDSFPSDARLTSDAHRINEASDSYAVMNNLETNFTSDFYRLCPVESNKSLSVSHHNIPEPILTSRSTDSPKLRVGSKHTVIELSECILPLKDISRIPTYNMTSSAPESPTKSAQSEDVEKRKKPGRSAMSSPAREDNPTSPPTKSAIPVPKKLVRHHPKPGDDNMMGVKKKVTKSPSKGRPKKELAASKNELKSNGIDGFGGTKKHGVEIRIPRKSKSEGNSPTKIPQPRNSTMHLQEGIADVQKTTAEQIRELNKMLSVCGDSEEILVDVKPVAVSYRPRRHSLRSKRRKRKKEGCVTSWVHVEADVDLSDPKVSHLCFALSAV